MMYLPSSIIVLQVFEILNCAMISRRIFFSHQEKYLHKCVQSDLQMSMLGILQLEENGLILGGDGRCDSPGFSAKYGSYSFLDLERNAILHVELVHLTSVLKYT